MKGIFISTKTLGNHDLLAGIGGLFGRPIGADKLLYAQSVESVTGRDIGGNRRRLASVSASKRLWLPNI